MGDVATNLQTVRSVVRIPSGARLSPLFQSFQTGSGVHPVFDSGLGSVPHGPDAPIP